MVTLANVQGGSLVPDFSQGIQAFTQGIKEIRERRRQEAERSELFDHISQALPSDGVAFGADPSTAANGNTQQQALARIFAINPAVGNGILNMFKTSASIDNIQSDNARADAKFKMEQQLAETKRVADQGLRDSVFLKGIKGDTEQRLQAVKLAQEAQARGDTTQANRLLELSNMDQDQRNLELQRMEIAGTSIKTLLTPPDPFTDIGKARRDLARGDISRADLDRILSKEGTAGEFIKASEGVIVNNPDGSQSFAIPVLNKETGRAQAQIVPIEGDLVSKLGETPAETAQRKIQTAGQSQAAKAEAARIDTNLQAGVDAAEALPVLNQTLDLLETMETGGTAAVRLKAKQIFGIESAEEGVLQANLQRSVLAQLRPIFGTQFTEREGALLRNIEAGIFKSTAANRAIIKDLIAKRTRRARRAGARAERLGFGETKKIIDEGLSFKPGVPSDAATTPTQQAVTVTTQEEFNALQPGTVFIYKGVQRTKQ